MSTNSIQTWLAIPHDPLVFRDGKPFTATPGARATSVPFPFPSTLAGAVRTLSGATTNGGVFPADNEAVIQQVLSYNLVGPFLFDVRRSEVLFPAPQDALLLRLDSHDEKQAIRVALRPTKRFQSVQTNLADGLRPVAPDTDTRTKRHPKSPAFWRWQEMRTWLQAPQEGMVTLSDLGVRPLPTDVRTHVSIQATSGTAEEGALFQTAGLTFVHVPGTEQSDGHAHQGQPRLAEAAELALVIQTDAPLQSHLGALGGERRLAAWKASDENMLPACPDEVRKAIKTTKRGRLILVTPAHFKRGFLPTWVCEQHPSGIKLRIAGAAVGRPVHVSGWDYKERAPKPTRRLAPTGSVYFFEIEEGDDAAIERFIDEIWLGSISDDAQNRRDGFGVALLGTWK
ncbi:MAG TPA: type III-B CRISPR module-associated protein Cmr3 [Candidatus Tenderia sp.]|nr:type III-B CRISPR module-associated protein Cmr3 [Candidatus Tenderia sp.]